MTVKKYITSSLITLMGASVLSLSLNNQVQATPTSTTTTTATSDNADISSTTNSTNVESTTAVSEVSSNNVITSENTKSTLPTNQKSQIETTAKATATPTKVALGTVKINYKVGSSIAIWNSPYSGRHTTGKFLKHGTSWKYFKKVVVNNETWYNLGGDQWIPEQYTANSSNNNNNTGESFISKVTITYQRSSIAVWNSPYSGRHTTGQYLKPNSSWKTFKKVLVNNKYWYNLGGNQWIPKEYTDPTNNNAIENYRSVITINYRPNSSIAVWNSPFTGRHTTGKYLKNGTSWKTSKRTKVNNQYWYNLGGNQWIPGQYTGSQNTSKIQTVINAAKSQLGVPYAYGAATPGVAFDCSGLTMYAYKKAGKSMGHYTVSQESAGKRVSIGSLKAGDLIFWGNAGATYHVGIYLGNNQYIHATKPGDVVKISSISNYFRPSFGVRVF